MRGINVKQAAAITGGSLSGRGDAECELRGLVIDSRLVREGFAFAAIAGEHVDGHDYVEKPSNSALPAASLSMIYLTYPAAL